jgi:hypothetical protein
MSSLKPLGPLIVIVLLTLTLYALGSIRRPRWWVERRLRKVNTAADRSRC